MILFEADYSQLELRIAAHYANDRTMLRIYNENGDIRYGFSEYIRYGIMDRYGIMNRITGEPITLALYSDINMISEGLFEVREYDSYEWYLLDTNGNVVSTK